MMLLSHKHHSPSHLLTQTLSHLSLSPTHLPTHHRFTLMMLLSLSHSSLTQPPAHPDTISLITITHSFTHTSPIHSHDVTLSHTHHSCTSTHRLNTHLPTKQLIYPLTHPHMHSSFTNKKCHQNYDKYHFLNPLDEAKIKEHSLSRETIVW